MSLFFLALIAACGGGKVENTAEGITIDPGFVRTPSVGAPATAGYLSLTSSADDVLISASVDGASVTEIHTMTMNDGVMQMRRLEQLALPAGETVELAPGGYHLMIMNPDAAMAERETVNVTLTFSNAAPVTVELPVQRSAPQHGNH